MRRKSRTLLLNERDGYLKRRKKNIPHRGSNKKLKTEQLDLEKSSSKQNSLNQNGSSDSSSSESEEEVVSNPLQNLLATFDIIHSSSEEEEDEESIVLDEEYNDHLEFNNDGELSDGEKLNEDEELSEEDELDEELNEEDELDEELNEDEELSDNDIFETRKPSAIEQFDELEDVGKEDTEIRSNDNLTTSHIKDGDFSYKARNEDCTSITIENLIEGFSEPREQRVNNQTHKNDLKNKISCQKVKEIVSGTRENMDDNKNVNRSSEDVEQNFDNDPFTLHYERNLGKSNCEQIHNFSQWNTSTVKWKMLGKIKIESPTINVVQKSLLLLDDTSDSTLPEIGFQLDAPSSKLEDCHIKEQLRKNFVKMVGREPLSDGLQHEIISILCRYADFYYPESTYEKWERVRQIFALHILNHILKTRSSIVTHNTKLNKQKNSKTNTLSYRDQGFTRPKVLILIPFKNSAYKLINTIIALLFNNSQKADIQNRERFEEEYRPPDETTERLSRPEDFNRTFEGDIGEDFKIGLSVTKKSLKLYTEFYKADIIIASPLGLRFTIGTKGEKDYDGDFLSSIEILLLDQADIFLMQNWEHILVIMESLNNLPRDIQKLSTNLERIRLWSLDGLAPQYRQTIVFSSTIIDHNRALVHKTTNFAGKAQVLNLVQRGSLSEVIVPSELIIRKVNGSSSDSRFDFFTQKFLKDWRTSHVGHTLIYVPDYCDYVRLVRFIKTDGGSSVATINEYMVGQNSKVAKARSLFFDGKKQFLIYTERFHFYRRYRIKGVQHVIFYDLPTYPHFFAEVCNWMVDGLQNPRQPALVGRHNIGILYQECNSRVIGVLGSERTAKLEASNKPVHMCTIGT